MSIQNYRDMKHEFILAFTGVALFIRYYNHKA